MTHNLPGEVRTARLLPFPAETVFAAFGSPAALAAWWGPRGFTNTFHEFDFRPGGAWRYTMHGPDGGDFENESEFVELSRPSRVVLRHLRPMHAFVATFELNEVAGGTLLDWRMRFDSAEECERVRPFVEPANEQNLDRLAAYLEQSR